LDDDQRKQEEVMRHIFLVAIGGGLGAALRHLANLGALRLFGPNFPWGTMGINITGSLAMGLFIELLARRYGGSIELRLLVASGILGGFTTFSAFSLDFAMLAGRDALGQAIFYALASVILSILALFAGLWLVRTFAG
jgi:fluoride exporter